LFPTEPELIGRIATAASLGAAVGLERLLSNTGIGPRTLSLVCLGSAAFTVAGFGFQVHADPARVAAQVASGIGFLGAGLIFVGGGRVRGITTAADIWVVAAIGLLCGVGFLLTAAAVTGLVLFIVAGLRPINRAVERRRLGWETQEELSDREYALSSETTEPDRAAARLAGRPLLKRTGPPKPDPS
jgi:putative Mg2+ transporter-C (MgtC) family protein